MKSKVAVRESKIKGAGRGVFATADIKKGEVIEICPILIFREDDTALVMETALQNYVFEYEGTSSMFALGFGSLYNHRKTPNAIYELLEHEGKTPQDSELYITAIKPIAKNEEVYINYGPAHDEKYAKPKNEK